MEKAVFTYLWDLNDNGIDHALRWMKEEMGATGINLACAYHTGKFLLPDNPKRKLFWNGGSALYFQPRNMAAFGRLQPRIHPEALVGGHALGRVAEGLGRNGMALNAWIVCLHNSYLASGHPDAAVETLFGEKLPYALCPASPDSRQYVVALVQELARDYPIGRFWLEWPAYAVFEHRDHHELIGIPITAWLSFLLGLCFCPNCLQAAKLAGVDGAGLRARLRRAAVEALSQAERVSTPDQSGEMIETAMATDPDLQGFMAMRQSVVEGLLREIRAAAGTRPGSARLTGSVTPQGDAATGLSPERMADVIDTFTIGYAYTPTEVKERIEKMRALVPGCQVIGGIRALWPPFSDGDEIPALVAAFREAGADGVDVYNFGLARREVLRRLRG